MNKNKGFSLVELIVVVAIMAVLVGILAPAYLSYVEKTRRGTDENTAEEVRHSIEVATADLKVYDQVANSGNVQVSFSDGNVIANKATGALKTELEDVYSDKKFELKSKKYKNDTYTVTIRLNTNNNGAACTVTGAWTTNH
jgi:type IV pilus assembly protein PilA